jgi:hypothetical protein
MSFLPMIDDFSFEPRTALACWVCNGTLVEVRELRDARHADAHNVVFALPSHSPKQELSVFDGQGSLVATLAAPRGYEFEYLVAEKGGDVQVVCSGRSAAGDVLDWYFSIGPKPFTLTRRGRAY